MPQLCGPHARARSELAPLRRFGSARVYMCRWGRGQCEGVSSQGDASAARPLPCRAEHSPSAGRVRCTVQYPARTAPARACGGGVSGSWQVRGRRLSRERVRCVQHARDVHGHRRPHRQARRGSKCRSLACGARPSARARACAFVHAEAAGPAPCVVCGSARRALSASATARAVRCGA